MDRSNEPRTFHSDMQHAIRETMRLHWQLFLVQGIIMLILGILQEYLQLASFKNRPAGSDEIFDLTMDLLGAVLAFVLVNWHFRLNDMK